jgi:5-methyltetrahydropteroyltriglutamate--homocysteine methyltransferase
VTDGEFRRRSWWLELILGWEGFAADRTGSAQLKWRDESGVTQGFSDLNVIGKIRWRPSSVVRAFEFLKANARAVPKVTLPAPNCVHYYMGGRIAKEIYRDRDEFWSDLVGCYRTEIRALIEAGARYIQLFVALASLAGFNKAPSQASPRTSNVFLPCPFRLKWALSL